MGNEDYLTTHYVWVLQNEAGWYRQAQDALTSNNFGKFRRLCGSYISNVRKQNNEILTVKEVAFIVLELWAQMGGPIDAWKSDPGPLHDAFEVLQTSSYSPDSPDSPNQSSKEQTMNIETNQNVAIETRVIIFGRDANSMSEQELIEAIKRVESQISSLKEVKTSSKKIASSIKELEKQLEGIVEVLDAR